MTLMVLVSATALTSCEKSSSKGTPVVRYVRSCDPLYADKLLTEVSMGSTVAIIGENLGNVIQILFNDRAAKLNPTLITPTSIIVTVPSTMPDEVTGKIYLTTKGGKTVDYDFNVIIPSPSLASISCEWALPGDEVSIYGNYFFPREEDGLVDVLFPGNAAADVTYISADGDEIRCIVPESATVSGNISVTSEYGTSRSSFVWRDTEGMFIDFEDTSWNWWGYGSFETDGGCNGTYQHYSGTLSSWGWPGGELWVLYFSDTGETLIPSDAEASDYALRFEYYCTQWDCVPMIILFDKTGAASFDNDEAQYHWKLYEDGYTPNTWTTKTIPLTDFTTNKEENEDRHISIDDMVNFVMAPFGATDDTGRIDLRVDNIRLVKIN